MLLLIVLLLILHTESLNVYEKQHNIGMNAGIHKYSYNTSLCSYENTCTVSGYDGVCVSISAGCCNGIVTSNLCPGSSDIKCCTQPTCNTPSGNGICMQTNACTGTSVAGYCSGPSDIQCCVNETPATSCRY